MLRRYRTAAMALVWLGFSACYLEHNGNYCQQDTDCHEAGFQRCDKVYHACATTIPPVDMAMPPPVDCTKSDDCPVGQPICGSDHKCTLCTTVGPLTECAAKMKDTPFCGAAGGCVGCNTKDDCEVHQQTCDLTMHTCVRCSVNADCSSGLCNANGTCGDKISLLYVDGTKTTTCSDSGAGTFDKPYCHVQAGLAGSAAAAGKTVVVFAATYAENLSVAAGSATSFTANAVGVSNPVVRPSVSNPALKVDGANLKSVALTMDGFTFDNSALDATLVDAVDCAGNTATATAATKLTLTHSVIKSAKKIGLNANNCNVTLDAGTIVGNAGGGIQMTASDFALTNLLVRDNGTMTGNAGTDSTFGGIFVASVGSGQTTMANLTVVNNKSKSGLTTSGINCTVPPTNIINSIIYGNVGGAYQAGPTDCALSYCLLPDPMTMPTDQPAGTNKYLNTTTCTMANLFVDPTGAFPAGNYAPKKGGTAPCTLVDVGTNTGAPPFDIVGTKRPQNNICDVGAYESLP